jgi:hypothetical protein
MVYREASEAGRNRPAVLVLFPFDGEDIVLHRVARADDDE